ncbi:hypothetical protein [Anaerocolumna sp. MB42-C2]|uniref:hypothetical protein n=1 Tax=Anaerocolumna sp. MB42-C2 TaxID=3070997 RepID=UPI0027DFB141|nr:hypothetical protein [Anaerocolumna sp. MB42-C2]WMJ88567.1 hypothetical protein RBU59_03370 [Anaerocolumna sp. MB42-C2]
MSRELICLFSVSLYSSGSLLQPNKSSRDCSFFLIKNVSKIFEITILIGIQVIQSVITMNWNKKVEIMCLG